MAPHARPGPVRSPRSAGGRAPAPGRLRLHHRCPANGGAWQPRERGLPANGPVEGLGGPADDIHAAGQFGLARWSGDTWTLVIDKAALGSGYHALDEVCATDNLLLVTDKGGHVLRRAR
jgi:hypothetical protein